MRIILFIALFSIALMFVAPATSPPSDCTVKNVPTIGGEKAQDLDGDCLYEDVNGDNQTNILDTQSLFVNLDNSKLQKNAEAFDFSNVSPSSRVSIFDIAQHWQRFVYNTN